MKVVIIGSSIAGHTLATALRQAHKDCSITLVTQSPYPAYDKRKLLEYLTGTIKEKDLFLVPPDFYQQHNINYLKECKVVSVAPVRKQVSYKNRTDRRESLDYDLLAVCSGTRTVLPEVDGIHKEGVYTLDSLSEYKELRSHLITDPVCIMGSGGSALSVAQALSLKHKEVKVISSSLSAGISGDSSVEILATDVVELIGEAGIQAIRLREGKIIGTSLPVYMPEPKNANIDFLKDMAVETEVGRISVDDTMRTSAANIYAAGSVCVNRTNPNVNKSWDDVIIESKILADNLVRVMGG
ncbi:MAG: FAD/NAD(P)-binding oxidoreductase [Candidatus Omnitrophota bacterium]